MPTGDVARWGPGAAHLRDLLAYAMAAGCRYFDFTIGDERSKLEWSDCTIKLCDYVTYANWRGWPMAGLMLAGSALKRKIKQNPKLWSLVMHMGAVAGSRGAVDVFDPPHPNIKSPPISPQ